MRNFICSQILLIALLFVSMTMGQEKNGQRSPRAPQPQLKYQDPNGLKVDWKFFGILNQFRPRQKASEQTEAESQQLQDQQPQSQLVQIESDRLEHRSYLQHPEAQPEAQQIRYKTFVQPIDVQSPDPNQIQYGRYSDVPHAKQVIVEDFKHPDPSSSVYAYPQQPVHQQSTAQYEMSENYGEEARKTRREYANRGRIVYKGSYEQQEQEPRVEHIAVPVERLPSPIPQKLVIDKNMPLQIQQLLQYQARLPYEVIANTITYKPKSLFVPKPIPVDGKGPYQYRSKVYYVNNEQNYDDEFHSTKPVQENQRH